MFRPVWKTNPNPPISEEDLLGAVRIVPLDLLVVELQELGAVLECGLPRPSLSVEVAHMALGERVLDVLVAERM